MRNRYGENITNEARERLAFELQTIYRMGFSAYFLIVQDFINWEQGAIDIPVGPRAWLGGRKYRSLFLGIT